MWTIFLLIFISMVLGAGAWLLFLWAVRSDQFEDVEGAKHRMLDDDKDKDQAPE
ncbi:MAG: cbb3-type cytochrome oxidase assembly protein CcoS [Deltaproteobacteria bacterium]|nr:cbb3-type cytochrome oxidase assembly protein CcoS [Candidatus Deferrimicrobiaceae bacterium]